MRLKFKIKDKAQLPAGFETLYVEQDELNPKGEKTGAKIFVLDVEGAVDFDKFREFRDNNIALKGERDTLIEKYGDLDPAKARELEETVGGLKADEVKKLLKDAKGMEDVLKERTKAMAQEHAKVLKAAQDEAKRLADRLTEVEINQVTLSEATKRKLLPTATLDITSRARSIFKLHEGKPAALSQDGKVIYGKDGVTPLTISDWLDQQLQEAPHLFEQSSGGGAGGTGSGGASSRINPWNKATFNRTQQALLERDNPTLAATLKASAKN